MRDTSSLRRDALIAFALALLLGAGWSWAAWGDLVRLRLPDTDDVMRLVQVRDLLAGQRWHDLAQHRLGPPGGTAMHWTRLADIAPAASIAVLAPLIGRHSAEVATVIAVPIALFGAALFLVGRIARMLSPPLAGTATIVAALAYPATTVFLPGRIDHHGLQLVLMLAALLTALGPAGDGAGIIIGLAAAASLVIGLETAPVLAAIGAAVAVAWALGGPGERGRLTGIGIGALVGLGIARGVFRPDAWAYPACDGFTAVAWRAALPLAALPAVLAAADPLLHSLRGRIAALAMGALSAGTIAVALSPSCLAPYGQVDPFVAHRWLAKVAEAQSILTASPATALAYLGLAGAGLIATLWQAFRTRRRGWLTIAAGAAVAFAVALVQLRGAYAASILAAPGLAAAIDAARRRGLVALFGAWAASAGLVYPIAAQAVTPITRTAGTAQPLRDCVDDAIAKRLALLPPGTVLAPIDAGPRLLATTPHRVIAAPYHRDTWGLRLALRTADAAPPALAMLTAREGIDYLIACAGAPHPAGWRTIASSATATILAHDTLSEPPRRP